MKAIMKAMKKPKPAASQFEALVDEATTIYRELVAASSTFGDARDEKLSARGFLNEALKNARTTLKKIEALDAVVAKLPDDGNEHLFRFLGTATRQAAATRMDRGVNLRPPTGNLHRLIGGGAPDYVAVIVESNMIGSNPFELIALAALRATRDNPDAFGRIDDWDRHLAEQEEKQARLRALYEQIAEAWKGAQIEWDNVSPRVRYGDITMPVAPPETLGERICVQLCH